MEKIADISADEIDLFLLVSFTDNKDFNYKIGMSPEMFKARCLRLQDMGLIEILNPEDSGTNLRHSITPLGRRVRGLLINSTAQLLRGAV
jgi:hypothetical protein